MSGSFAAGAAGLAGVALEFSAPDQSVSLGDFVFEGFEVPEKINWGGKQHLVVHKLIGGQRVIDEMGPDDDEISWSGIFLSDDASERAERLNQMRIVGGLYELIFAGRYYLVAIADFKADTKRLSHVPYHITCTISSQLTVFVPDPSHSQEILNDLGRALTISNLVQNPVGTVLDAVTLGASPPVSAAAAALGDSINKAITASSDSSTQAGDPIIAVNRQAAITSAYEAASNECVVSGNGISGYTAAAQTAGNPLGATSTVTAIPALQNAASLTADQAASVGIRSYLGRANFNAETDD